eukprot:5583427-Pyramimonas_sp.AAC.1
MARALRISRSRATRDFGAWLVVNTYAYCRRRTTDRRTTTTDDGQHDDNNRRGASGRPGEPVSYTHLRAHETGAYL